MKARRYLTEGRVIVTNARAGRVRARVRGDGAVYLVEYDREWSCTCPSPALVANCSHAQAVRLVTAPDLPA